MTIFWAILQLALIILIVPLTLYGFIIGAPIFFSPKKGIGEILAECHVKPGEKFYDLGAGNGRAMILAAKKFNLDVYGFELSPLLVLIAKLNLLLCGVKKSTIYLKNLYNEDLSNADIIFCFLTPKAMERLRPKFEKELRPGTRIISYAFPLKDWQPKKIIRNGYPGNMYLYEKS
ncbi:MAG: 50S ribosomal protein L11 methyltransferase [Parcubacteria group bacterium]|jgi:SAM-dependent methyltransferase